MMKILILILGFVGMLQAKTPSAWAIGSANDYRDEARDMLRSENEENENADATSKWGDSIRKRNQQEYRRVTRVDPISESSFVSEENRAASTAKGRAPASVGSTRGPAALPEMQPKQVPLNESAPMAAIRAANKRKAYQETAVIASEQGFFPSVVFVTQGIPVRMFVTGASARSQCLILDAFGVRRQIKSQRIEEISFTPETAGTYTFTCPMNGARGQIVVREIDVGGRLPASTTEVGQND